MICRNCNKKHSKNTKTCAICIGRVRKWQRRNKQRTNQIKYDWIKRNPEKAKEIKKKCDKKRRSKMCKYMNKWKRKRRKEVVIYLGGKCSSRKCGWINEDGSKGCTDFRALQVDHIKGGGTKERRILCADTFYSKILKGAKGYQLLCANCNWIKRYKNKEVKPTRI